MKSQHLQFAENFKDGKSGVNYLYSWGSDKTKHGEYRANQRGFNNEKIEDIVNNYSQKVYQPGERTVYAKKNGKYYDVNQFHKY